MESVIVTVSGGVVTSIRATTNMNIYLIDYDNIRENRSMGLLNAITPYKPDDIIPEEEVEKHVAVLSKEKYDFTKEEK
jgi:hypothetical protein